MEHMELAGFWGYCKDFLLMENIMHFSLFPTSNLLFSPFKTFFFSQKVNVDQAQTSIFMDFTPERIVSRHLKINVEALVLF